MHVARKQVHKFSSMSTQVVDIHLGDQGEVIANIPVRVSAKAVFAQYTICPLDDINFGSMVINNRKQTCFTIHNKGDFEFKYAINKQMSVEQQRVRTVNLAATLAKNRVKSRERVTSANVSKTAGQQPRGHSKRSDGPTR